MRIALGTAQFGSDYGVCNSGGKVDYHEIRAILSFAYRSGITKIDTASGYGDAEQVLGQNLGSQTWKIMSKLPSVGSLKEEGLVGDFLKRKLTESLSDLNRNKINTLLVHGAGDLLSSYGDQVYEFLRQSKENGLVCNIGVSVYDASQIDRILNLYEIDVVQIPLSIVDQRLVINGYLDKLKDLGIQIYARSVFLQGILVQDINKLPAFFMPMAGNIRSLHKFALSMNMSRLELCTAYALGVSQLEGIIVGVNSKSQLEEIVKASTKHVETTLCRDFAVNDSRFLNPTLWDL
jgi:aryl-alcohol dehydrogenase-like predicted oxidoreductase